MLEVTVAVVLLVLVMVAGPLQRVKPVNISGDSKHGSNLLFLHRIGSKK